VSERERGEGELYKGVWTFQSAKRDSNPGLGVYILPLPVTSRYGQNAYLADSAMPSRTVRVWIPTVKMRSQRLAKLTVGPGGPSARTPWIVRPVHRAAPCSVKNNGPSAWGLRTVRLEAHFLEKFCQKSQILNKYQKPADRPPQGPGLSAQQLKTDIS
jgi:hypothetical protein